MKGGKGGKEKGYIYKELRGEYKSLTVGEVMPDGGAFVCWVSTNIIMRYVCISCIMMWYVVWYVVWYVLIILVGMERLKKKTILCSLTNSGTCVYICIKDEKLYLV